MEKGRDIGKRMKEKNEGYYVRVPHMEYSIIY